MCGAKARPISKDKAIVKIEHESKYDTGTYSTKFMFSYMQWIEYLTLATLTYISNLVGMCVWHLLPETSDFGNPK